MKDKLVKNQAYFEESNFSSIFPKPISSCDLTLTPTLVFAPTPTLVLVLAPILASFDELFK